MLTLLAPARWILQRLPFAGKFALIAVVLLTPLGFVTHQYRTTSKAAVAFSAKERVGVDVLGPLHRLLEVLVEARSAAVAGRPVESADRLRHLAAELAGTGTGLEQQVARFRFE